MKSVKIGTLNPNPKNPRLIKDEKYKLLLHSVKVSPAFMLMNPIKVDLDNMILCGNMRYKACMELQKKVVPVEVFTKEHAEINNKARREEGIKEATYEEQCLEYIIKDNVSFGEHDWDILGNDWEEQDLEDWGMDVWTKSTGIEDLMETDLDLTEDFDPIGESAGMQRVVFIFDGEEEAASYLTSQNIEYKKRNMAWQVNMTSKDVL
tara:strand:- start:838 stop:1458 length:621 start_codon:yes stop_codon:yes gene_type:complete